MGETELRAATQNGFTSAWMWPAWGYSSHRGGHSPSREARTVPEGASMLESETRPGIDLPPTHWICWGCDLLSLSRQVMPWVSWNCCGGCDLAAPGIPGFSLSFASSGHTWTWRWKEERQSLECCEIEMDGLSDPAQYWCRKWSVTCGSTWRPLSEIPSFCKSCDMVPPNSAPVIVIAKQPKLFQHSYGCFLTGLNDYFIVQFIFPGIRPPQSVKLETRTGHSFA